jgi:hypothetical protein
VLLTVGWIIFLGLFFPIHIALKGHDTVRKQLERGLVEFMCSVFVASWTGVVKYHGPRPSRRAKQVPSSFIRILSLTLLQVSIFNVFTNNRELGSGPLLIQLVLPRSYSVLDPQQLWAEVSAGFCCKPHIYD